MCINILHNYMDVEVAQAQLGIVTLMVSSESVGQTVRCLATGLILCSNPPAWTLE